MPIGRTVEINTGLLLKTKILKVQLYLLAPYTVNFQHFLCNDTRHAASTIQNGQNRLAAGRGHELPGYPQWLLASRTRDRQQMRYPIPNVT